MSSNPHAFAQRVLEAFEQAGHATDEEVGDAGGPSTTTLAKYRKVASGEMTMTEPRGDVLKRIDRAAGWRGGSARALWREQRDPGPPQEAALEALRSKPGRTVSVAGPDGYVEWLAERLSEVEERIDLLAAAVQQLRPAPTLSAVDDSVDDLIAAHEEEGSISGEQEQPTEP